MTKDTEFDVIPVSLMDEVCQQLRDGERVRQELPGGGLLSVDRLLPFLVVYRRNPKREDAGTEVFVTGEASYINAPGQAPVRKGLRRLIRQVAATAKEKFDACLIIEIWSGSDASVPSVSHATTGEALLPCPEFRIHEVARKRPAPTVNELVFELGQIRVHGQQARVQVALERQAHPPGLHQLMTAVERNAINCFVIGLEVLPIYRHSKTGKVFPDVLRQLHTGIGQAIKKTVFSFAIRRTNTRPQSWFSLGRSRLSNTVLEIDGELAEIGTKLNLLLNSTPINAQMAWEEFEASGFTCEPTYQYRPLATDPWLLKRRLNLIPTEKIVDATLSHLMRQTQDELDRMITMLSDIGTDRFLPGSMQVFGRVESSLLKLAEELLEVSREAPPRSGAPSGFLTAKEFARKANAEIRAYRNKLPDFAAKAVVRDDMYSGLLASSGQLYIGRETQIPKDRAEALLAHEVGTHLVTYYNGRAQPLRLLSSGLAGYDAMQEGLAVLSEHLVGGLSRDRLRMLAARVVAVSMMIAGKPFRETWSVLTHSHGFSPHSAYTVTMRVYRGGGLTKDAVYLRGLVAILEYLKSGQEIATLFIGKVAVDHVPIIEELLHRGVLLEHPITPRYIQHPLAGKRLERIRSGTTVLELLTDE